MIYLYSGTPGSGKTLKAVSDIWRWLRSKDNVVITNIRLDPAVLLKSRLRVWLEKNKIKFKPKVYNLIYKDLSEITPEWLITLSDSYKRCYLVMDECQIKFNSRAWNDKVRMPWLEFFSKHRHYNYQILLIAQHDRMLDRQIRELIEYNYIHRYLGNMGVAGFLINLCSMSKVFVQVQMWCGTRDKLGTEMFLLNKHKARSYDTYQR